jgi:hypothetical protein
MPIMSTTATAAPINKTNRELEFCEDGFSGSNITNSLMPPGGTSNLRDGRNNA